MSITRRRTCLAMLTGTMVLGLTTSPANALRLAPEPADQSAPAEAVEPHSTAPTSPDARERWVTQRPKTPAEQDTLVDVYEQYPWLRNLADYPGGAVPAPVATNSGEAGLDLLTREVNERYPWLQARSDYPNHSTGR